MPSLVTPAGRALLSGVPGWALSGASIDMDFANARYFGRGIGDLTVSRASSATDLLPTSASGVTYNTFGSGIIRLTSGVGVLIEEARTNVLLNSTAPATQTTASLGTGTYTLWVNGSGSATSSAGTATITGAGAATNGTPNTFVVTVAGTVVITKSGSLNAFQCELGTFGTSLIVTTGETATRAADVVTLTNPPVFGSAYSLYAKGTPNAPTTYGTNQVFVAASDGTNNNRVQIYRASATAPTSTFIAAGGVNQSNPGNGAGIAQNASGKISLAVEAADTQLALNGTLGSAGAAITLPALSQFNIGSRGVGDSQFNGYIAEVALWPTTRIPNATLQTITSGP